MRLPCLRHFASLVLLASLLHAQDSGSPPTYDASDASAPPVQAVNLTASERFWPYHVSLLSPVEGISAPVGLRGVLLRVETDGRALIDFGRDGTHRLPSDATDLLTSAEAIRLGTQPKEAPNFTFMVAARLIRADAEKIEILPYAAASGKRAYLCAIVPVEGDALESVLAALPPGEPAPGVMPIFFPLGQQDDRLVRQRLRTIERPWAFVYDHLADSYAHSLLPPELAAPALLLLSPEGRVLAAMAWDENSPAALAAALAAEGLAD